MSKRKEPGWERAVEAALVLVLIAWGLLIFFENAWFAAPAFGVAPPSWAAWVGGLSVTELNVIDTVGTAALITLLVIGWWNNRRGRRLKSTRGAGAVVGAIGIAVSLVGLLLILWFLGNAGISLSSLIDGARRFLGL